MLKTGVAGACGAVLGSYARPLLGTPRAARASDGDLPRTPIVFKPFQAELPMPPDLIPVAAFATDAVFTPEQQQFPTKYYQVHMRRGVTQIIPGVDTEIWGYNGIFPGPTIRARLGEPAVVRQVNDLDQETCIHFHGGHVPAASDGYPADLIAPGQFRDYAYPNQLPGGDVGHCLSTAWYHDHAQDITGQNVYQGLAAFYLVRDDVETALNDKGTLPTGEFELPLVLQDRVLNADGSLFFDPLNHDGFLGDVFCVNGKAQPYVHVRRRRYRLRVLNGSNARFYMLRLSTGARFLAVGSDSTLLPSAVEMSSVLLGPAERVDLVVDFKDAPGELYLENIVVQDDGRGPRGTSAQPETIVPGVPLIKFVVNAAAETDNGATSAGDVLRPLVRIRPDEIVATRRFEFNRDHGAWTVNGRFFDPDAPIATPRVNTAERWILVNSSGGWWHPIHVHHELQQVQSINGGAPPARLAGNKDTVTLGPNDVAEVFIKFRDFTGRYVFHCHNLAHEDMAMMGRFDVLGG